MVHWWVLVHSGHVVAPSSEENIFKENTQNTKADYPKTED
jgi:hypothetical protein